MNSYFITILLLHICYSEFWNELFRKEGEEKSNLGTSIKWHSSFIVNINHFHKQHMGQEVTNYSTDQLPFSFSFANENIFDKKAPQMQQLLDIIVFFFLHSFSTIFSYCTSGSISDSFGTHSKKGWNCFKQFFFVHLFYEYAYFTIDFDAHVYYFTT